MKFNFKKFLRFLLFFVVLIGIGFLATDSIRAYSPHSVESTIKNNWDKNYGYKSSNMRNGVNIVYDVYSKKYFNGGYRIINKDFGKGSQPYLNFRGWAVNFGYKRHTSTNHDTYIVAQNVANGATKIYKTDHINISATEDVEYNNQGSGVWNECPSNATKKDNIEDCNMRYDNVGFDAYLPLDELFPDISKDYSYVLYLVKEVDGHIVYTPLILPFEFDKHTYNGGEVDLTSGVNANKLRMIGSQVLRRTEPRGNTVDADNRYFTTGNTYTRIDSNEDKVTIWYGVNADGRKRWGSTAYWVFGGEQAQLNFKADDKPPVHISDSLSSHIYKNGNDYWTQPNDQVVINLRQRDVDSGNKYQYLRLYGSSQDVRARHTFSSGASTKTNLDGFTSSHVTIDSATRTENTTYGRVNWYVTPKKHGDNFNIHYYYTDLANNSIGYNDTSLNLRVDGVAPTHQSQSITGAGYVNGSTYWVNSGDKLTITVRQRDVDSGNKYQYLRALNDGKTSDIEARSQHSFSGATTHNSKQVSSANFNISSAKRTEDTTYGKVEWTAIPKGHGRLYTVQRYYQDNVNNNSGYTTIGTVGVDDEAPIIQFRNKADTSNYSSQDWTNNVIDVRLKFSDDESGYKRSRYVWTQSASTPTESQWSSWSTSNNYLASQSESGEWYLHVQAEDNLGNKTTTKTGFYKINQPPVAKFSYSTPNYEGDTITLTNLSTDPEGHSMTALWTIEDPYGETKTYTSWDLTIPKAHDGEYFITLKVTDEIGASDEVSDSVIVIPLILEGNVFHAEYWQTIHEYYEHEPDMYYSGEVFNLEAYVTNYPIKKVEVDLVGTIKTGKNVKLNQEMNYHSETKAIKNYTGSIYEQFMSEPETMFESGSTVYFRFRAEWENGIVKEDIVKVRIIGNVFEPFELHRTN